MRSLTSLALASASVLALVSTAAAQTVGGQTAAAQTPAVSAPGSAGLGEVIVTARRRSENLENVPQTVEAVSGDTLHKLAILRFEDVEEAIPGLSLSSSNNGYDAAASLRGVSFNDETDAQPTVALYLNDAPVQALFLFQSMFDVGQLEVLKGPQGTTRGISAPSGAITLTTQKPGLSAYGGYVDTTLTDLHGRNLQGAVNIPLIKDVLALRVSAAVDENQADGVHSIHNDTEPDSRTRAVRASLLFKPNDRFDGDIVYQHLDRRLTTFTQVSGPGQGSATDPAITPEERLSVQNGANQIHQHFDVLTAETTYHFEGQRLTYVGSYQSLKLATNNAENTGDVVPGIEAYEDAVLAQTQTTQEVRLASEPSPRHFIDYTIGGFYNWQQNKGVVNTPGPLLYGAFGTNPNVVDLQAYNPSYQIPVIANAPSTLQEISVFGNATLHLDRQTELSMGLRQIWSISNSRIDVVTGNGLINLGGAVSCASLGAEPGPNPGDCILPTAGVVDNLASHASKTPLIYNLSLARHLTRNLLIFFDTGTAYRPPVVSATIQGALASSTLPVLQALTFHPAEDSRSYEAGFKSTWLKDRARFNVSLFRQDFTNLIIYVPGIDYFNTVAGEVNNVGLVSSVNAQVQGFDVDSAIRITPEWTLSAQMSYADGRIHGSLAPCNVTGSGGQPVFNTAGLISLCPGGSSSRLPLWNANLQSEYVHPLAGRLDGFLRILANYYPQNRDRVEPDFTVGAYSLVNLFVGVRSPAQGWEASVFARNAFETRRALDIQPIQLDLNTSLGTIFPQLIHPSGYYQTQETPRREVGVNLHYAFGPG